VPFVLLTAHRAGGRVIALMPEQQLLTLTALEKAIGHRGRHAEVFAAWEVCNQ